MHYYIYILFFVLMMALVVGYLYWKSGRMIAFYHGNPTKGKLRLIRIGCSLLVAFFSCNMWTTMSIVLLHLIVLFGVMDVLSIPVRLLLEKKKEKKGYRFLRWVYYSGIIPVALFLVIMVYGFNQMEHIQRTEYHVSTIKQIRDYRIALLSDIHYGTVQSADVLKKAIDDIDAQNPDIVVLDGDIVEEGISKEEMEEVFALLGSINNKYGIYYVYGNHDRQTYTKEPSYTRQQLENTIQKNGIQILKDCYVRIQDDLILAGRDDAAWGENAVRKETADILSDLTEEDKEKKMIVLLDHQPVQMEENGSAGVDLQLSGHTHAGQLWPVGIFLEAMGQKNYGMYHCGVCRGIVSSGVAGWRYGIRTNGPCEYVMVDLICQGRK